MTNRRNFLRKSVLAAGLTTGLASCMQAETSEKTSAEAVEDNFLNGMTILFQGDSITDGGRYKDNAEANHSFALGTTYPNLVASQLLSTHINSGTKFYNRGISGNKVFQLAERWDTDCIDLKPDVLTILIGVNDFWHMVNGRYEGTVEIYENDFMALMKRTQEALPGIKLVIAEPFAVAGGRAITDRWTEEFPAYRAAAKRVSDAFGAVWIPTQQLFDDALKQGPVEHWCPDGVHPSPAGHYLMAQAWIDALRQAVAG